MQPDVTPETAVTEVAARDTPPSRPAAAFTILASVQFTLILAMSVLSVALPQLQREFGLSRGELALVTAAYGMSFSGLLLLGGRLSDMYGRRRAFVTGTAVFGAGSAAAGLATGMWMLLAARFVQGAGAALAVPAAMALVGSVFPDPVRYSRALALWGGLAGFGGTTGILLSGVVASWDSWRWAFAAPVVVAITAVVAAPRVVPPGPAPERSRLDVLGAVLATAGISVLGYGLVEAPQQGWTSPVTSACLAAGVLLLVLFVRTESRTAQPLLPLSFVSSPRTAVALVAVFLGAAGITTIFFMLSLYFQQVSGMSAIGASLAFLPFGVVLVATGLSAGRLVQRFGSRAVTAGGLLVAAAGLALLGRMGEDTGYLGVVSAGLLLFPAGVACVFAGATVSATAGVPARQAGLAGAVVNTALEAGPTLGLAVLVTLASARTSALTAEGAGQAAALAGGFGFGLAVAAALFAVAAPVAALLLRPGRPS
ncbi:MFS transporter [Microbispora sp. NPDC049633]|uniref:MFS transporter n=1 Tax=Microbispora sp. NPDC049633 TaxID=3154355 RepID=UPI00343AC007